MYNKYATHSTTNTQSNKYTAPPIHRQRIHSMDNECGNKAKLQTDDELNADKRCQASGNVLFGVETTDFDIRLERYISLSSRLDLTNDYCIYYIVVVTQYFVCISKKGCLISSAARTHQWIYVNYELVLLRSVRIPAEPLLLSTLFSLSKHGTTRKSHKGFSWNLIQIAFNAARIYPSILIFFYLGQFQRPH
jgi:hypothetical protein